MWRLKTGVNHRNVCQKWRQKRMPKTYPKSKQKFKKRFITVAYQTWPLCITMNFWKQLSSRRFFWLSLRPKYMSHMRLLLTAIHIFFIAVVCCFFFVYFPSFAPYCCCYRLPQTTSNTFFQQILREKRSYKTQMQLGIGVILDGDAIVKSSPSFRFGIQILLLQFIHSDIWNHFFFFFLFRVSFERVALSLQSKYSVKLILMEY